MEPASGLSVYREGTSVTNAINTETIGKRIAEYPGEWVAVDADRNRVVAHNVLLARLVVEIPAAVSKPAVYYSAVKDGPRQVLVV